MDHSNLFNNKEHSDLTAIIDDEKIFLHKIFLFSKSTVLKNMFNDCVGNEVNFSMHPFKACLKPLFYFLYSGQLIVDDCLLGACLEAVHFFEIKLAKKLSAKTIITSKEFHGIAPFLYRLRHVESPSFSNNDFFGENFESFNIEDFDYVPDEVMVEAMTGLSSSNLEFDQIFIKFEKKYSLNHPSVEKLIPFVQKISVPNLLSFCAYDAELKKMGKKDFEDIIKACIEQNFQLIEPNILSSLPFGLVNGPIILHLMKLRKELESLKEESKRMQIVCDFVYSKHGTNMCKHCRMPCQQVCPSGSHEWIRLNDFNNLVRSDSYDPTKRDNTLRLLQDLCHKFKCKSYDCKKWFWDHQYCSLCGLVLCSTSSGSCPARGCEFAERILKF